MLKCFLCMAGGLDRPERDGKEQKDAANQFTQLGYGKADVAALKAEARKMSVTGRRQSEMMMQQNIGRLRAGSALDMNDVGVVQGSGASRRMRRPGMQSTMVVEQSAVSRSARSNRRMTAMGMNGGRGPSNRDVLGGAPGPGGARGGRGESRLSNMGMAARGASLTGGTSRTTPAPRLPQRRPDDRGPRDNRAQMQRLMNEDYDFAPRRQDDADEEAYYEPLPDRGGPRRSDSAYVGEDKVSNHEGPERESGKVTRANGSTQGVLEEARGDDGRRDDDRRRPDDRVDTRDAQRYSEERARNSRDMRPGSNHDSYDDRDRRRDDRDRYDDRDRRRDDRDRYDDRDRRRDDRDRYDDRDRRRDDRDRHDDRDRRRDDDRDRYDRDRRRDDDRDRYDDRDRDRDRHDRDRYDDRYRPDNRPRKVDSRDRYDDRARGSRSGGPSRDEGYRHRGSYGDQHEQRDSRGSYGDQQQARGSYGDQQQARGSYGDAQYARGGAYDHLDVQSTGPRGGGSGVRARARRGQSKRDSFAAIIQGEVRRNSVTAATCRDAMRAGIAAGARSGQSFSGKSRGSGINGARSGGSFTGRAAMNMRQELGFAGPSRRQDPSSGASQRSRGVPGARSRLGPVNAAAEGRRMTMQPDDDEELATRTSLPVPDGARRNGPAPAPRGAASSRDVAPRNDYGGRPRDRAAATRAASWQKQQEGGGSTHDAPDSTRRPKPTRVASWEDPDENAEDDHFRELVTT
ncbi:unnamed protein product [Pedinophyceae sp. YPF-701]|nr:unnamed protein product [Pedinophyceae sp. YPF-701]